MKLNPILAIDFYKSGHIVQYPEGTEFVYSNFTPRSSKLASKIAGIFDEKVVFFGLQGFIQWFLIDCFNDNFFKRPKDEVVAEYKWHMDNGLGPDSVDVSHIAALHDLGYLPVQIKALPEGSLVNVKVPMLTVCNTHKDFFWLTNYLEDVLSNETWKSCTTATTAWQYRKLLDNYADETGASKEFVMWQGHDFSFRGVGGVHDGAKNSAGHLLSFYGTDTIPAIAYLRDYYYGAETFIGGSVPATEHSVMCMGGEESEVDTFRRLITETYPSGVVSIVSDTWDFWNVITNTAVILKDEILNRTPNALGLAKVVFRPDSGDPVKIVTGLTYEEINSLEEDGYEALEHLSAEPEVIKYGSKFYAYSLEYDSHDLGYGDSYSDNYRVELLEEVPDHIVKGAVECIYDIFGGTVNAAGYNELNPRVGLIYGDSITLDRAQQILKRLKDKGFASSNIVFGIGSFTYQYQTRDSYGFAMKATFGTVNGVDKEIFKLPKTGDGTKNSAKGLLRVEKEGNDFVLCDQQTREQEDQGELKVVFRDGVAYENQSLAQIREVLHGA